MKLQRLLSLTRQAVDDYALIDSGDKIAVGISGGKDSLTLLYALHGLQGCQRSVKYLLSVPGNPYLAASLEFTVQNIGAVS